MTSLDKCRDVFFNVVLNDKNFRNVSMAGEIRALKLSLMREKRMTSF